VGQAARLETGLAPGQLTGLAGRLAGPGGADALLDDAPGLGRVALQPLGETAVERPLHEGADLGVAQLGLGLALELGLAHPDGDDGGETLTDALAGADVVLLLQEVLGPGEVVGRLGEGLRRPSSGVPPSWVLLLLAKERTTSL